MDETVYQIKAIIVLDNNGKRLCSCFYDPPGTPITPLTEKDKFEKLIFEKCKTSNCELEIIENKVVIGSKQSDVWIFVVGNSLNSNELALLDVLNTLISLFKKACATDESIMITKKTFLENYALIRLYIDEIISDGIIFEIDEETILNRVPIADSAAQSLNEAIEMAKEKAKGFGFGFL
ncbi:hypothetical protein ACTFIZ_000050 [Dictyostelium cf. discoideum]